MDDSVFDDVENDSDGFTPELKPKPKAKPATKKPAVKPAPKKMVQTTLKSTKAVPKKRAKPASDDEGDEHADNSDFSQTPPKKKTKPPAPKKAAGKPLEEIENDSMMLDGPSDSKPAKKKSATETYQKLTQLEHIIKRPDTYIGSVERTEQQMWVFDKEQDRMVFRKVNFVPGLYKIFDEILVNAADNKQRDPNMKQMKVKVNREAGEITVENDGKGIPVEMHEKEGVLIPELVFGHLLAGSNFDDDEKKTVGGRNGYGAKLCNVFSTEFTLECQDSKNGKRYKQTWHDNMGKMDKAKVTSNKSADFVRVTFKPDFDRFGMPDGIDDDLEALINRRVYDMAGTVRGVKVFLNDTHLKLDFKKYCEMYAKSIAEERGSEEGVEPKASVILEDSKGHPRWEIAFSVSNGSFQQVSFVNSIATTQGGTHVNYIADMICNSLLAHLNKKKKGHALKANHVKNHIFIFVNCLVTNPAFTSQTKEQLTTKSSQFGSKCLLTEKFMKDIAKTDAITNIIDFAERKADKMMAKSDGNKRSRINNAKLVDANLAGTKYGHECTLILTEGDSAKSLAVAGRAILDPDRIGVFPLRGKMLNVRDASIDQITKNQEIQNIKQFLGLKHKTHYTDTKSLRYGHLMIMADQDHDGSHIKGLLINFLQVQFPSLLQIPDFFREFITPIVKIWQGPNPKKPQKLISFFTQPQYENWKGQHQAELKKWQYKYYKGLGTSSNEDAQVYFTNLDDHLKEFDVMKAEEAELFELAFSKKKADARKEWLGNFVPGTFLDHSSKAITYDDFVNRELILFSMADNMRSIPSMIDGLKPGQRKVLFACLKRNLIKDKKVVELAGYVSEQTAYHHGEVSLQQTIVALAQNFVGSNNVNILEPSGNFGSRLAGGSDAASARYIHTRLSPFARKIFSPLDEPNLENNVEDGKRIEPKVYAPVIPMLLVNGGEGIGTGWSTSIPNHHPMDIVKNLRRRMGRLDDNDEQPFEPMTPWFRGWKGTPSAAGPYRYQFDGIASVDEKKKNEVLVTELPIRMWTDDFKAKLEDVLKAEKTPSWIKDYKEFNDHKNVHFEIQVDDKTAAALQGPNAQELLLEKFKLQKQVPTSNLVAFDTRGMIRKYETIDEIMEEYYVFRLKLYKERKAHWLGVLNGDLKKLSNQARFIKEIMDNKLVVNRKKKQVVVDELRACKYDAFPKNSDTKKTKADEDEVDAEGEEEIETESDAGARDYDYLLSMPIWSFTQERLDRLMDQMNKKKFEHDELEAKSEKDLWCADLDEFELEWESQLRLDAEITTSIRRMGRRVSKKIGAGRGRKPKGDDDYAPAAKSRPAAKPAAKAATKPTVTKATVVPQKTHQAFTEKFSRRKSLDGTEEDSDAFSDDDFAALKSKPSKKAASAALEPAVAAEESDDEVVVPAAARGKRAAAAKPKAWIIDDDDFQSSDDDDKMLGDVGALVKGIPGASGDSGENKTGRVSLFAMSRPDSSQGNSTALKVKSKPNKTFDMDSHDDTNYEMLAKPSPHKSPFTRNEIDSFLSDDDLPVSKPAVKTTATKAKSSASPSEEPKPAVKKARGRAAGTKNSKPKEDVPVVKKKAAAVAKPAVQLSPAAKLYKKKTAEKAKPKKDVFDLDDDEDEMMAEPDSPEPRPAARSTRPGRAAAAKKKPVYIIDDDEDEDEDDMIQLDGESEGGQDESDDFAMDDSE
ncbi:DNA topoisomerase [Truncatella angustata]|uniref:DNA topoisomerase 2 n=1 Tax=Truncatella angustata TaxID=152316 RepID=A0A9P8UWX8_9PEZI|nr:DNA topoisomerase [Truncatella angustata]KAH6659693.1 DNA topoisomerase [Truncatella angustata]